MVHRYYLKINDNQPIDVTGMGAFTIGRKGDIKIFDPATSRIQCLIALPEPEEEDKLPYLVDGDGHKSSMNGTTINGRRTLRGNADIETEKGCRLIHGTKIKIGSTEITFLIGHETSSNPDSTLGA